MCPSLPLPQDRVIELRALGEAVVSLSCCDLSVHASGGLQRLSWTHEVCVFTLRDSKESWTHEVWFEG